MHVTGLTLLLMSEEKGFICSEKYIAKVGETLNDYTLSEEELRAAVDKWHSFRYAIPLNINHDRGAVIGYVRDLQYDEDRKAVKAKICIMERHASKIADYPILGYSIEYYPEENFISGVALLISEVPAALPINLQPPEVINPIYVFAATYKNIKVKYSLDFPVVDKEWDSAVAIDRILERGGWSLLAKCVVFYEVPDGEKDPPEAKKYYHFPFCDVVDGKVVIVRRAISAIKVYANGARGYNPPPKVKSVLNKFISDFEEKESKEEGMAEKNMKEMEARMEALRKQNEALREELEKTRALVAKLRVTAMAFEFGVSLSEEEVEKFSSLDEETLHIIFSKMRDGKPSVGEVKDTKTEVKEFSLNEDATKKFLELVKRRRDI